MLNNQNMDIEMGYNDYPSNSAHSFSSYRKINNNRSEDSDERDIEMGFTDFPSKNTVDSFSQYTKFNYILIIITIISIIFALVSVSGPGRFFISVVLLIVLSSFFFCKYLINWIFSKDSGDFNMRTISNAIQEGIISHNINNLGAEGFLKVQYSAIAFFSIATALLLFTIYLFRNDTSITLNQPTLAFLTSFSFLLGSFCSGLAGYIGVWVSVRVNIRVASAASKYNYDDSLKLAFRGGALSAILSAAMCILGLSLLYLIYRTIFVNYYKIPADEIPMLLAGYGFGASFVALFMQLGGGIYTKAADVGADMVGKIEQNIPEDDPRNPAVIADLVGDNVGDCAGSMADVFESIAAEIIGTMILGGTLAYEARLETADMFVFFPLMVHAFDLLVSGVGIMCVYSKNNSEDPLASMKRGYIVAAGMAVTLFILTSRFMLHSEYHPEAWWRFACCGLVGIVSAYALVLSTQYYTDYTHGPVQGIALASKTGHGTNILAGLSVGLESTGIPTITIAISLLTSYALGMSTGFDSITAGLFGTAVCTMGMLCTAVFILSMNNFGPIADNAGGVVQMSNQSNDVRAICDRLDAVGNVTKAATKGYAVGGSALACFVLFQAFLDEVSTFGQVMFNDVNLTKIEVIVSGVLGICMIFIFTGWSIQAVGKTAQKIVIEVRNQLSSRPGILLGTETPDYNHCVSIVTKAALKEMIKPALFALLTPIAIGIIFRIIGYYTGSPMLGIETVAGFLIFASLTGLIMAIFLDNAGKIIFLFNISGGAWDNAKKYVEANGSKGSEQYNAAVTGDCVGDPAKDTAGPSLHVIITTMSTTILVVFPLFINNISKNY